MSFWEAWCPRAAALLRVATRPAGAAPASSSVAEASDAMIKYKLI